MVTAGGAVTDGQKPVRRSSWPGKLGGYSLADLPGKKEGVQAGVWIIGLCGPPR